MCTILILGGFGFIGSNILSYIDANYKEEFKIIIFDRYPYHRTGYRFHCVEKVYSGDFSDDTNIRLIFSENNIDIVLHLLSSTVPITSGNALYDVETNLIPTLKLLRIMHEFNVKDIIYFSSGGAIYGDYLQKVHKEEDAAYPKSSYGIVKLAIEKYLLSYNELFGFNTLIFRLSNPYGYYQYNNRQGIINIAIRKAIQGEKLQIWGNGEGLKDYIFIEDVCHILFHFVKRGVYTDVYNLATGYSYSINEIVQLIKKQISSFEWEYVEASKVDIQNVELDISKLKLSLDKGFCFTDLATGIQKTINWYQTHPYFNI